MSWISRGLSAPIAAIALAGLAPSAALAGVVVSSSGPSAAQFPVGRQIGPGQTFTLREGDTVTILENGGTRIFRGAGNHSLGTASAASRNRAFAALTTQRAAVRARTGAVRSTASGEVSNPSLWYVDVAKPGTICLPQGSAVRLWRADTQAESTYAIAPAEGSNSWRVTFPAGEMLAGWSTANPPAPGTAYRIGHGTSSGPVEVRFAFLDTVPGTPEALAGALIANGCTVQLDQMAAAMTQG